MQAIPKTEYEERIKKFQRNIREAGLDAALVHSNEADICFHVKPENDLHAVHLIFSRIPGCMMP